MLHEELLTGERPDSKKLLGNLAGYVITGELLLGLKTHDGLVSEDGGPADPPKEKYPRSSAPPPAPGCPT